MPPFAVARGSQRKALPQPEAVAQHQPLPVVQAVGAQGQRFQPPQVAQQQVIRIMVVPLPVVQGQERLARVLLARHPRLHIVAVAETVAQGVVECRPQVIAFIPFPLVERDIQPSQRLVPAMLQDILQDRETLRPAPIGSIHADKRLQLVEGTAVHPLHQLQLVEAFHRPVDVKVSQDILHLPFAEERKLLQLAAGGRVQVEGRLQAEVKLLQVVFVPRQAVALRGKLFKVFQPQARRRVLGGQAKGKAKGKE